MISTELISLIGGSFTGFLFRYMAEKRLADQENFKRLLDANARTTQNQDNAVKRVPIDAGKAVRQLIVLVVLFGTIIAPFILPFFGIPTIVEVDHQSPELFFGLIPARTDTIFESVYGYLFTKENREILIGIVGFYFGSAAGGAKS
jgi:hypothetical protein